MDSKNTHWITLAIALFLVVLQVLQPFIHGHLDVDHPIQNTGFHLNENPVEIDYSHGHDSGHLSVHTAVHASEHTSSHALSDAHVFHTIAVASGMKQEIDPAFFADLFSFVLLFCFAIVLLTIREHFPQPYLISSKFPKRRLPAPRAPPYF